MLDKRLLALIRGQRKYIVYAVLLSLAGLGANLSITAGICWVFGQVIAGGALQLWQPVLLIAGGIAVRFLFTIQAGDIKTRLGSQVKTELRRRAYDKMLRLGVRATQEMSMAGLTQMTMEGIEQLDLYYSTYLPQFFYAMIAPVVLFLVCVGLDWPTALVLLCCVPLIPASIVAVSKCAKRIFAKYWGQYTSMGDGFLDSVQGLKDLKIFQADGARNQRMNQQAEDFRRITMKVLVMQLASTTIMDFVAYGGAGLGVCLALRAALTGTSPAVCLFLILVAVEFFLPLRALGSAFHVAMNGASAGQKILQLLEQEEPQWGGSQPPEGGLALDHVTFSYDGRDPVLRDVSMFFPPHTLTAIVGESGAGKSTVVSLLSGAHRAGTGRVLLGGAPVESLDREAYYRRLAVVSCNTYIFNDTVRANFQLADPQVSEPAIWEALAQVRLGDFIRQSGGLDKVICEDGTNLSGGQKQRLALAIALAANREIYLFDEATSNIDVDSETVIMENVRRLAREKAVILISHRLANVESADQIYVLSGGGVAESGRHESLLNQGGEYARMYLAQKGLEEVEIHG